MVKGWRTKPEWITLYSNKTSLFYQFRRKSKAYADSVAKNSELEAQKMIQRMECAQSIPMDGEKTH